MNSKEDSQNYFNGKNKQVIQSISDERIWIHLLMWCIPQINLDDFKFSTSIDTNLDEVYID